MIKATFKTRNLNINIANRLLKFTKSKTVLKEIGEFTTSRIALQARRGKPMRKTRLGRFPKLSPFTPPIKKTIARMNPSLTHRAFGKSGNKRNITQSGQLLDGLRYRIRKNTINIYITGSRKLFKDDTGKKLPNQAKTNIQVYRSLLKRSQRYNLMAIDPVGVKRIKLMIQRQLRKALRFK